MLQCYIRTTAIGIYFPIRLSPIQVHFAEYITCVLHGESYKGLAPPRKTTKHGTPTINPNDRQSAPFTDQELGRIHDM